MRLRNETFSNQTDETLAFHCCAQNHICHGSGCTTLRRCAHSISKYKCEMLLTLAGHAGHKEGQCSVSAGSQPDLKDRDSLSVKSLSLWDELYWRFSLGITKWYADILYSILTETCSYKQMYLLSPLEVCKGIVGGGDRAVEPSLVQKLTEVCCRQQFRGPTRFFWAKTRALSLCESTHAWLDRR